MQSNDLKELAVEALEELKANDIQVLEVSKLTSITDYMIIASGRADRHAKAIAENVIMRAKHANIPPLGVEGLPEGRWVLVDLGDVVVHVMAPETREFYKLEKLWAADSKHRQPPPGEQTPQEDQS